MKERRLFKKLFKFLAAAGCFLLLFGGIMLSAYKQSSKLSAYAAEGGVEDFVSRLYMVILDREADEASLDAWTGYLESGELSGTEVAQGFIMSDEFLNKPMTNEEFVQILYSAFFDREADPEGLAGWVDYLDRGYRKSYIFAGFANSTEFGVLCDSYEVKAGSVPVTVSEQQPNLSEEEYNTWLFVERMYTEVLTRTPAVQEIKDWAGYLQDGSYTGAEVASGFILSNEFQTKPMTNEAYVKIMYKAFFGREADPDGLAGWVNALDSAEYSKEFVFAGFANSGEFGTLCENYGIIQGEVNIPEVTPTPEPTPEPEESKIVAGPDGMKFELFFDEETGRMDLQYCYDADGNKIDSIMVFYGMVTGEPNSIIYSGQLGGHAYDTYYEDGTLKEHFQGTKDQDWYYAAIVSGNNKDDIECEIYHVTKRNTEIKEKYSVDGNKESYEEDTFLYVGDINMVIRSEYLAYHADGTVNYLDSELQEWERDENGEILSHTTTVYYASGSAYKVEEHTYIEGTGSFDEENLTVYYEDGTINYADSYNGKNIYREDGSLRQLEMYSLDAGLLVALHEYNENNIYTRATWYFYVDGIMSGYAVSDIHPETWEKLNEKHYDASGKLLFTILFDENGDETIVYPEDDEIPELGEFPEITLMENYNLNTTVLTSEEEVNTTVFEMVVEGYYGFGIAAEDISMVHTAEEYMWLFPEFSMEIDYVRKYSNCYYVRFKNVKTVYGIDVEHMYAIRTGDTSYLNEQELATYEELLRINEELGLDDMETDMEKIKAVHDYLVLNTAYDEQHVANDEAGIENENQDCHYVEGTLLNGLAVCSGYASTFRLFMELQGIHCDYITNATHGWNAVELDGKWYFMDVTWDDPVPDEEGRVLYTYFMVPEDVLIAAGGHDNWSCECGVAHVCDSDDFVLYPVKDYVFTTEEEAREVMRRQAGQDLVTLIYPADGGFIADDLLDIAREELGIEGSVWHYPESTYYEGYNWIRILPNYVPATYSVDYYGARETLSVYE